MFLVFILDMNLEISLLVSIANENLELDYSDFTSGLWIELLCL